VISGCLKSLIILFLAGVAVAILVRVPAPLNFIFSLSSDVVLLLVVVVFGGVVVIGVISAFVARLDGWVSTATRPNQPQVIKLETKETPSQIAWAAVWATFRLFIVLVVVLVVFLVVIGGLPHGPVGATPLQFLKSLVEYLLSKF
jgi:hypothetical protein